MMRSPRVRIGGAGCTACSGMAAVVLSAPRPFQGSCRHDNAAADASVCRETYRDLSFTTLQSFFYRGAFLVIVPRHDHQEGKRLRVVVITAEDAERILEGLPAAGVHAAVPGPRGLRVVEAGPRRAHGQLFGILRFHLRIERLQVIAAPIAAIR